MHKFDKIQDKDRENVEKLENFVKYWEIFKNTEQISKNTEKISEKLRVGNFQIMFPLKLYPKKTAFIYYER